MRSYFLAPVAAAVAVVFLGCGPSAEDRAKMLEVKAFLLKVVKAQKQYKAHNQTYSLNMQELYHYDPELEEPPAGYRVKGGGGLALAFGYQVHATPEGRGPHLYVNQSGVVRYSNWGTADEKSDPVR